MNIFVDTNILLDMYHLSGPDLDELRKIVKLMEVGKIKLLTTQQVEDEFWRNREGVIADAIKQFKETKATIKLPNLIRTYEEAEELIDAAERVNAIVKELLKRVETDIAQNALKADEIITELFKKANPLKTQKEIVEKAKLRMALGNPPGKKGSLGDAINWEMLLSYKQDPLLDPFTGTELIIISSDGDYESELHRGKIKEYLFREWDSKKQVGVRLYKTLPEFLKAHFPEIRLSGEIEKLAAIERLEKSGSFTATHKALSILVKHNDYTEQEVLRMLKAFVTNDQIYRILDDDDVLEFTDRLMGLARSEEAIALAKELDALFAKAGE